MLTLVAHILPWLFWCTSAAVSIEFWNWLDDQRELKYLPYLRKFRWQRFVAILYATVALVGVIMAGVMESSEYLNSEFTKSFTEGYTKGYIEGYMEGYSRSSGVEPVETPTHVVHYTLGMFLGSFFAALLMAGPVLSRVLNWVTKTEGSWAYIGRSIPILIAALIAAIAAFATFASGDAGFSAKTPITVFIGSFWAMFVTTPCFRNGVFLGACGGSGYFYPPPDGFVPSSSVRCCARRRESKGAPIRLERSARRHRSRGELFHATHGSLELPRVRLWHLTDLGRCPT
jgi:hypothetical protein